ncbi:MAG: hypothetical protein KUG77_16690 [Nannocystaceae bacterium]|nr:hypothetical protein [Nannocystaceae bacterium]
MTSSTLPRRFAALILTALVATPALAAAQEPAPAKAGIDFLVLRENATGSASAAQGYIDDLVAAIARTAGWDNASGKYVTRRSTAEKYVAQSNPQFGIVSLSAYLALKAKYKLSVLGKADIQSGGGHQFFVVSKNQLSLAGCKTKSLGTNHSDATFIDKIVSGDDFDLSDFEVEDTRRPVKTLKSVIGGEVECALIDDAQLMELQHLDGGLGVHPVWSSVALPPMVVVAFPGADAGARKGLATALESVCEGEGKAACEATSIKLEIADGTALAEFEKAYGS